MVASTVAAAAVFADPTERVVRDVLPQVAIAVDHVADRPQVVAQRPEQVIRLRFSRRSEHLIGQQLVHRRRSTRLAGARVPQVAVREVAGLDAAAARLVELQDDLALAVEVECLVDRGVASVDAKRVAKLVGTVVR